MGKLEDDGHFFSTGLFVNVYSRRCALTDVEGARRLVAIELKYEEVAGLTVMAEPQGHS